MVTKEKIHWTSLSVKMKEISTYEKDEKEN